MQGSAVSSLEAAMREISRRMRNSSNQKRPCRAAYFAKVIFVLKIHRGVLNRQQQFAAMQFRRVGGGRYRASEVARFEPRGEHA